MNIVVRGLWPNDGLEGLLESQGFICDPAAILPRQLVNLMTVEAGYFAQQYEIRWCHGR